MSKKTIIKGTLILTIAGVATRLLGFYNRIFLTQLIGAKELGVYQLIFPLYLLSYSICSQGISISLTKNVSYLSAKKENSSIALTFRYSVLFSLLLSLICSQFIFHYSDVISIHILKNSECDILLKMISVAIPFVSVKSCINSFFIGMEHPGYHGINHLVEQIFRIGSAYIISLTIMSNCVNSKLAVVAVVIGEASALVLAFIFLGFFLRKNNDLKLFQGCKKADKKTIRHNIIKDSVPLTINNVLLTAFSSVEAILIPAMLFKYYNNSYQSLEMYGIISGIVLPFLMFPATITNSLSTMLMPAIAHASAGGNTGTISSAKNKSLLFCFFLGLTAWIGFSVLGDEACEIAFKSSTAGEILCSIGFLCPLIYLSGTQSSILNGLDKTFLNLVYNIIALSIRIGFTLFLVPIYGVKAYIAGMTTGYTVLNILLFISTGIVTKNVNKTNPTYTGSFDTRNN